MTRYRRKKKHSYGLADDSCGIAFAVDDLPSTYFWLTGLEHLEDQVDLNPEFREALDKHFWELLD